MTTDTMLINKFLTKHKDKQKASKMQKLLNWGIVSWIIYNLYKIWTLHGAYRLLINAFPALGR